MEDEQGIGCFVRPTIRELAGYTPGEQPQGGGYVKLNTNENPYPPSPQVIEAIRRTAAEDLRLYPDPLANVLRDRAAELYGFERDEIVAGNGSDDLLAMIVRACVGPGDRVAYPVPTYSLYDTLVKIGGGDIAHVPFGEDFRLPDGLAAAGAQVTFLCNPNSPSGTAIPLAEIAKLSAAVSGLLVVDEAYADFADENALPLVRERRNVLVLRSFSKSFALAGMRVGLGFGHREIIRELLKVKDSYNLDRVSIAAAAAALADAGWMRESVARIRHSRDRLAAELMSLGFVVPVSQANFVLARRPGSSAEPLYQGLKERRILVRYFAVPGLEDALRITVGTDEEIDRLLVELRALLRGS